MNAEIKLCPFCGHSVMNPEITSGGACWIECLRCDYVLYGRTKRSIIKLWNTRPGEAEANKKGFEAGKKACANALKERATDIGFMDLEYGSELEDAFTEAAILCESVEVPK